ncbi:MAG: hypothetical protein H0U75_07105 [Legionella sp.]|nr:hypothetical protein [Legionella sp.]
MINLKAGFKNLLPIGLGLTLAFCIVLIKKPVMKQPKDSALITARLNTIQMQLESLQQEVKKPANKAVNQDFNKLASMIEELKHNNETNQLITENRTELTNKLDSLHTMVTALDKKQHPIKYLPMDVLPFKIISIDSIQQVSVATIIYDFKTLPLEKSDKLAGWEVLNIDFGQQRMELKNANKEHVVVKMNNESGETHD